MRCLGKLVASQIGTYLNCVTILIWWSLLFTSQNELSDAIVLKSNYFLSCVVFSLNETITASLNNDKALIDMTYICFMVAIFVEVTSI